MVKWWVGLVSEGRWAAVRLYTAVRLRVTSSSRRHLENSRRRLTDIPLMENQGLMHSGLFQQRVVTTLGTSWVSCRLCLPLLAAAPPLQCAWDRRARDSVLQASEEHGSDSSSGSSFLRLGSSAQPEDFVI